MARRLSITRAALIATSTLMWAIPVWAGGGGSVLSADPSKHFDAKGKEPSVFTTELQNGVRATLPFNDQRDFEEAKKGFIAAPSYKRIMAEAGFNHQRRLPLTQCAWQASERGVDSEI